MFTGARQITITTIDAIIRTTRTTASRADAAVTFDGPSVYAAPFVDPGRDG